jgi:hypothetical protein
MPILSQRIGRGGKRVAERMHSLDRKFVLALIFVLKVTALSGLGTLLEGVKEVALSQVSSSDPALQEALDGGLKNINDLRKRDRSSVIDCTNSFGDFRRYQDIEPYVSFFKSIGIEATLDDRNGKHYIAFYFDFSKLSALGFRSFLRNDTLVVVFTTASVSSTRVMSFKCSLLNDGYL